MVDYPWWKSRKEIKKFLETTSGWGLGLPHDLTKRQVERLYRRHRPKEFVAFEVLSEIFDHPNCPVQLLRDGLQLCLKLRRDTDSCLNALALRKELGVKELAELADDFFGEDISDHALGALATKHYYHPDHRCIAVLQKAYDQLPRPKDRDMMMKRWLHKELFPKKTKKGEKRKKKSRA